MCKILPHFSKVVWNQTIRSLWSVFCLQRKNVPATVTFIKACENVACRKCRMISQRLASFIYFDENAIFKARKGN